MRARTWAGIIGLVAGLGLAVAGGLALLGDRQADWQEQLGRAGYAGAVVALAFAGYAMVAHAPVWLRAIVCVGLPLLVASVWQLVDQEVSDGISGWRAEPTVQLAGGVVALLVGLGLLVRGTERRGY